MKVVFIISNIDRWITFEWMASGLRDHFELHFILLNPGDSYFEGFLEKHEYPCTRINYRKKGDLPVAVWKVRRMLLKLKPDVVHTHFLDANLAGLTAAKWAGIPKRIHTRHHSVFHYRYSRKGVWYDRWSNWLSTDIVAISEVVRNQLMEKEGARKEKICVIHHGFDLSEFRSDHDPFLKEFKEKYAITSDQKAIGVIARYMEWKGVEYIIEAFKSFYKSHPEALLLLFNARGPDRDKIQASLQELPIGSYKEVPFEKNILEAYHLFSVFVHTPIDQEVEAFGQVYVEALAAGVPSIFTLSGIANEFVEDGYNALVVNHQDSKAIQEALEELWTNNNLRSILKENGHNSVQRFSNVHFCQKLKDLYEA